MPRRFGFTSYTRQEGVEKGHSICTLPRDMRLFCISPLTIEKSCPCLCNRHYFIDNSFEKYGLRLTQINLGKVALKGHEITEAVLDDPSGELGDTFDQCSPNWLC